MQTKLSVFCDKLIEAGWLASAAVIPVFFNVYSSRVFEPDKLTLLRVIVLVMALAWSIKILETTVNGSSLRESVSQFLKYSPLTIPVLAFAVVYVLSTLVSVVPSVSFWGSYQRMQGTLVTLCYITLFFLTAHQLRTRDQLDRLINVILFASIPVALYGVLQHEKMDPLPWGGDVTSRVTSSLGNSIFLAAYLIMVVPLVVSRLFYYLQPYLESLTQRTGDSKSIAKRPYAVALYVILLAIQLVTIIWTQSRGPWLGLLAGLAFMMVVLPLRYGRKRLAGSFMGVFVAIVAFIVLLNIPSSPFYSLSQTSSFLHRLGTIADLESGTNKVRMLIWFGDDVGKGALGLITANPIRTLVGWGPESMYVAYNQFYPPDLAHLEARNATPDRSHDDFLDFLVTMGLVGLTSYLTVVGTFFVIGIKRFWQTADRYEQVIILALLGAVVAHLVESLTGIAIAATRTHFWLYLAAVASMVAMNRLGSSVPASEAATTANITSTLVPASTRAVSVNAQIQPPRRGKSQRSSKAQSAGRPHVAGPTGRSRFRLNSGSYLLILFLSSVVVGVPVLLTSNIGQNIDASTLVVAAFVWLLSGMIATAVWVYRPFNPIVTWRSHNLWLYIPATAITLYICVFVFLAGIVADIHYKKGLSMENANRFDLAVPAYLDAIRWAPSQDFYFLFLGRAYNELAKKLPADVRSTKTINSPSDLFNFSPAQAQQAGRETTMGASVVALGEARRLASLNTDNSANLGRIYQYWAEITADPALRKARYDTSISYYEEAIRLSPNTAHLHFEYGRVYQSQGLYDSALAKYQRALELDSQYLPTYAYLGDTYRLSNDVEKAREILASGLEMYQRSPQMDPQYFPAFAYLGDVYFQLGDLDKALDVLLKVTQIDDSQVRAHSEMAYIYAGQGKLKESLDENLKAIRYSPNDFVSNRNVMFLYSEMGDIDRSLEWADKTLRIAPADQQQAIKSFQADLQNRKKRQ